MLGSSTRVEHVVHVQPGHGVPVRGQHGGVPGAAAGVHQLVLQPNHLLLHEQKVPPSLSGSIRLLQMLEVSEQLFGASSTVVPFLKLPLK